jgi:hypothetical protein
MSPYSFRFAEGWFFVSRQECCGNRLGQTKVENLQVPFRRDEYVAGLDVAMDEAALVGRRQSGTELLAQVDNTLLP